MRVHAKIFNRKPAHLSLGAQTSEVVGEMAADAITQEKVSKSALKSLEKVSARRYNILGKRTR
jgi:hypothetical protein